MFVLAPATEKHADNEETKEDFVEVAECSGSNVDADET